MEYNYEWFVNDLEKSIQHAPGKPFYMQRCACSRAIAGLGVKVTA